eukprot:PhF_6_TR22514/c0_g1_i4/m.31946/K20177/VPS3, TGFBRAP1; vacuolar protein sorting-associated protein 3
MLLFVGGSDGVVYQYTAQRQGPNVSKGVPPQSPTSRARASTVVVHKEPLVDACQTNKRNLNVGSKPVHRMLMEASGKDARLVCLCDGILVLVHGESLEIAATTKDTKAPPMTTFCFLENNKSSAGPVAVASRRKIYFYECSERKGIVPIQEKEMTMVDNVLDLAYVNGFLVVGLKKEYVILQADTGHMTDQASAEKSVQGPLLHVFDNSVLLRVGPSTVFYRPETSMPWDERMHVDWGNEEPLAFACCDTYAIASNSRNILVYSLLDRDMNNPIPNQCQLPYRVMAEFSSCICVASGREVHCVTPIPYERLLTRRIAELRIDDAVNLCNRQCDIENVTEEDRKERLEKVYEEAGFACFERINFRLAFENFKKSGLNVRDVLTLFPDHQSASCKSMVAPKRPGVSLRTVLDNAAADGTLEGMNREMKEKECRDFLTTYLWGYRNIKQHDDVQIAIDYALLMLYMEDPKTFDKDTSARERMDHFLLPDSNLLLPEALPLLEKKKCNSWIVLLYSTTGKLSEALALSKKMGEQSNGEEGIHETVVSLQRTSDIKLIMEHLPWVIDSDPDEGIKALLVKRQPSLNPELVMSLIGSYPEDVLMLYLEHAVMAENTQDQGVHTLLGRVYIHCVMVLESFNVSRHSLLKCKAGEEAGYYGEIRRKLLSFLHESSHYEPYVILGELNQTKLHEERVIVYSKCGHHDAALRVLVEELKDIQKAEDYCVQRFHFQRLASETIAVEDSEENDNKSAEFVMQKEKGIYHGVYKHNEYLATLIRILLHGETPQIQTAVDILTRHARNLNALKILSIVPRTLPVSMLSPYL